MNLKFQPLFDDNTSVVDATHVLGSPTYAWSTTGSGTFDDATSATPVITQGGANDDVVTVVVSGLATADGANNGTVTVSLDLNDIPPPHFVTGGSIIATP